MELTAMSLSLLIAPTRYQFIHIQITHTFRDRDWRGYRPTWLRPVQYEHKARAEGIAMGIPTY